jgi:glycine betaine/choline ABC-type transport system substrate-binding protein
VLEEIAKRSLEGAGFRIEHRQGMGGTIILWEALKLNNLVQTGNYPNPNSKEKMYEPAM